jgi:phosphatidylglycerophosphate synthase
MAYPVYHFLVSSNFSYFFLTLTIALFTDLIDGMLARKLECDSAYGVVLDPFADKILLIGMYLGVIMNSQLACITCLGLNAQLLFMILIAKEISLLLGAIVLLYYNMLPVQRLQSATVGKVSFVVLNIATILFISGYLTGVAMLLNLLAASISLVFYLKRILHIITQ